MKFWKLLLACLLALTLVVTPIIASATEVIEGEKQEVVDANPTGGDPEGGDPEGGDPDGGDPEGGDPEGGDPEGHEHVWSAWDTKEPNQNSKGHAHRACTVEGCNAAEDVDIDWKGESNDCGNHSFGEWTDVIPNGCEQYRYCDGNNDYGWYYSLKDGSYFKVYGEDDPGDDCVWCGGLYCTVTEYRYNHKWGDLEVVTYPNENGSGCDGLMARFCEVCKVIDEESKRVIKWYGEIDDCTKSGFFTEHNWDEWITREEDPEYIQWLIDEEGFSKCLVEIRWCLGHDGKIIYNPATDEYRVVNVEVYGIPDEYIYCGYIYCDTHEAKYEHDWGEWKVTKKPTTSKKGVEERVCKRCEAKETREIAKLKSESTMPKTGVETIPAAALQVSGLISAIGYALLKRRSLHR